MSISTINEKNYYKGYGTDGVAVFGDYQFTSLETIINQFQIAYVGEGKIIPKIKRSDIAFHAMRALQEFSFDTFKSIKSYQIDLPPSLVMPLPHDYVNYTKLSWVDNSGIKHLIYPTSKTNNPFQIKQEEDGSYEFPTDVELAINGDFSSLSKPKHSPWNLISSNANSNPTLTGFYIGSDGPVVDNGILKFVFHTRNGYSAYNWGYVHTAWQEIDTSDKSYLTLSADGVADTVTWDQVKNNGNQIGSLPTTKDQVGVLRIGLSTSAPQQNFNNNLNNSGSGASLHTSNNINTDMFDLTTTEDGLSYLEWVGPTSAGSTTSSKELNDVDVINVDKVYLVVVSYVEHSLHNNAALLTAALGKQQNSIDNISLKSSQAATKLRSPVGNETESSTWNNYSSATPSENNNDNYEDDIYWPINGGRYGLDPQHAQVNGSFFIDPRIGRIHFSSNISGKTVILDYISDSLGTDDEMKVHKFAEEAMYKCIAYSILSTSSLQIHQQLVPRFKKEKYAETRKAKLRLSNIKLEELTQILRGRSKQIKH